MKIKSSKSNRALKIVAYVFTVIWIFALLVPMFWMFVSATKSQSDAMKNPPSFVPTFQSNFSAELDTSGIAGYGDEDFKRDAAILLWMTMDRCASNVSARSLTFYRVENGKAVSSASLSANVFKSRRPELFFGSVTENQILRPAKYDEVLKTIKFSFNLSKGRLAAKSSNQTQFIEYYLAGATDPDNPQGFTDGERIYSVRGVYGRINYSTAVFSVFNNFAYAWKFFKSGGLSFFNFLQNSFVIAGAAVLLQWIISAMAGYCVSKLLPRRIGNWVMIFFILTLMIPGIVSLLPLYMMIQKLNLMNNALAVILPGVPNAVAIVLFKGFFDAAPKELREAAKIDGASEINIYARLIVPISLPVFGVMAILTFIGNWNDFFWPMMVLEKEKVMTFPLIIHRYMNYSPGGKIDYTLSLAMSCIAAVPTFILFAFFQRQMAKGLVFSGIKG